MSSLARINVVVVSYNTRELLLECLASIIESAGGMIIELIVVDNASEDGSIEAVSERHPDIRVIANATNVGFGAACNQAIRATSLPYVLLINSDARLTPEAFRALYDCLQSNPRCGAAGCGLIDAEGRELINTRRFLTAFNQAFELVGIRSSRTRRPRLDENLRDCSIDWIDGACLFLRREALDEVGLFDERFFMYSEDEDLCRRLRLAGWSVCFSAAGTVIHHGGASSARERVDMLCQFYLSQMLFLSKHRGSASAFAFMNSMWLALALKYAVRWLRRERRVQDELAERLKSLIRARRLYLRLSRPR
jgi:GT2 family glycosyltransferase